MSYLVYEPTTFPCLVYEKKRPHMPYVFSHVSACGVFYKPFPVDLSVSALLKYKEQTVSHLCFQQVAMVLVSGDVARCITLNQKPEQSLQFLFYKSEYSQQKFLPKCVEINDAFIEVEFKSTLACYEHGVFKVVFLFLFLILLYNMYL